MHNWKQKVILTGRLVGLLLRALALESDSLGLCPRSAAELSIRKLLCASIICNLGMLICPPSKLVERLNEVTHDEWGTVPGWPMLSALREQ